MFKFEFLILIIFAAVVQGKVVECSPDLTRNPNNRWAYCTKMAYARDRVAKVSAKASFINEQDTADSTAAHLQLFVFKED